MSRILVLAAGNDVRGDDGPYGPAVEVSANADLVDRIVALTGRDPHQGDRHV